MNFPPLLLGIRFLFMWSDFPRSLLVPLVLPYAECRYTPPLLPRPRAVEERLICRALSFDGFPDDSLLLTYPESLQSQPPSQCQLFHLPPFGIPYPLKDTPRNEGRPGECGSLFYHRNFIFVYVGTLVSFFSRECCVEYCDGLSL